MDLNHCGTVLMNTDRLTLRKFSYDDLHDLHEFSSDPVVTKSLVWDVHEDIERTQRVLKRTLENYSKPDYYHWAMELKEDKKMIGSISFNYVDNWNLSAELGYCTNSKYWGFGYTTEASKKLLEFAFERVRFNRIEARTYCDNIPSIRVIEKCEMRFEGIERDRYFSDPDGFRDAFSYAIIKKDFDNKHFGGK